MSLAVPLPAGRDVLARGEVIVNGLPTALVDDAAFLSPEARQRVVTRLRQLEQAPSSAVQDGGWYVPHIYTVPGATASSPDEAIEELRRSWRSRAKDESWEEDVILFAFPGARRARLVCGRDVPERVRELLAPAAPDVEAVFAGEAERGLLDVIDRIASLLGIPADYKAPPPVPPAPPPIFGTWPRGSSEAADLAVTIEAASKEAGRPIVLAQNPEMKFFGPSERAEQLAAAWPGRIVLLLRREEGVPAPAVVLRPADEVRGRFPREQVERIEREVAAAVLENHLDETLTRVVKEIAALSAGKPLTAWSPGKHPVQWLLGGPDASSRTKLARIGFGFFKLAALGAAVAWLVWFVRRPGEATIGLIAFIVAGFSTTRFRRDL